MGVTQVIIGVPKEICPGEERVALTPANVGALLKKNGVEIRIERGAGEAAGFTDGDYETPARNSPTGTTSFPTLRQSCKFRLRAAIRPMARKIWTS